MLFETLILGIILPSFSIALNLYTPPKTGRYKSCKICGKEIYIIPSQERRAKYCSITCMYQGVSGKRDKNNNTYLKDFRIMRKMILKNIKECSLCHQEKPLAIHHIDYNKENNNIKNLIPLCFSCHSKTNFKRQECQEFFEGGIEKLYVL